MGIAICFSKIVKKRKRDYYFLVVLILFTFNIFFLIERGAFYSNNPKGIRLILIDPQDNNILITWYTDYKAFNPEVEYSTNPDLSNSKVLKPDFIFTNNNTYLYTVILKNLEPNTRYYYQVSSDFFDKREIMSFKTFPKNVQNLKFLVISDSQTDNVDRGVRKCLVNIIQKERFDFYIHCGDVVENGQFQNDWNMFFEDFEELTSKKPGLYIQGNHDFKDKGESFYLNLPINLQGLDSYSIQFSNFSYFLGLNTEIEIDSDWLKEQFESNMNYDWKFSFFHQPVVNSMKSREDMNVLWESLFSEYNFSTIFSGHNHIYERLYIDNLNYINCPAISGDIKSPESFYFSNTTLHFDFARGFIIAEVDSNSLMLKILGYDKKTNEMYQLDNFTIYR